VIIRLTGELVHLGTDQLWLDVQGVTYQVFVSRRNLDAMPPLGTRCSLYTHAIQREDGTTLYGYPTMEERQLFLSLLGVSGVGARTALALLSHLAPDQLVSAIARQDAAALAKAPGVGKKTAERILLELREKVTPSRTRRGAAGTATIALPSVAAGPHGEVALALESLGYEPDEIHDALGRLSPDLDLESAIRGAIQHLSGVGG
jgi:Holliday junction DNA helicase RuvA